MRHKLFDLEIDDLSANELENSLISFLYNNEVKCIATPNPEMILDFCKEDQDGEFRLALHSMDLNLPDGVALRFAISALTDQKLKNRHTGVDTLQLLMKLCAKEERNILLFGGDIEVLNLAKKKIKSQKNLKVSIFDPGILQVKKTKLILEDSVIAKIDKIKPDVIAIALTHKKQLLFMNQFRDVFPDVKIMIGIGGALDMISGKRKRAPKFMRKIGLEWVWRALIEPRRIGRILKASVVFPFYVVTDAIKKKRLVKAIKQTIPEIIKQLSGN